MRRAIATLLFAAACGPDVPIDADDETGTSAADSVGTTSVGTTTSTGSTTTASGTSSAGSASGGSGSDDGGYEDDDGGTGCTFTCPPPPPPPGGGGGLMECDLFAQDCMEGEKCMPWANDGGAVWNATRCSPLDPDPALVGEACTVEGSGVSGIDNCELAAMCWDVDPNTNMGYCIALCTGTAADPTCPGELACIWIEGLVPTCGDPCDPLASDCDPGQACHPQSYAWTCEPIPADAGAQNEACLYSNGCLPSLACVAGEAIGCAEIGCCAELCDLNGPPCGGGLTCTPWSADPPIGLEHVGVCVL